MNKIIIIVLSVCLFQSGFCQSSTYFLKKNKRVSNTISAHYVFSSPDNKYICFSDEGLNNVYIKKTSFFGIRNDELILSSTGSGYFPTWSPDSKSIFMRSKTELNGKNKTEVVEYKIETKKTEKRPDIDYRALQSYSVSKLSKDPVVFINEKLQVALGEISSDKLQVLDTEKQCYQPLLAPDKTKIAVHSGSEIWIYDLKRQVPPYNIGTGLVTSWSSDSKLLVGFLDTTEDGHQISNAELYLFDTETKKTHQLTHTQDIIEANPSFSDKDSKIYYVNLKDGSIMSSKIKKR